MKKVKLNDLLMVIGKTAMAAVILCVLSFIFASCEKTEFDTFEYKPIERPVEGEYTLSNQDLKHNVSFVTEMNHGAANDVMDSWVRGIRGEKEYYFQKAPIVSAKATAENGDFGVKETYALNLNGISFKPMQVKVENIDGFYNRTQPWEGSMKVDNQNVTLEGKTLDFSKFFSPEEKVLQLGYSAIDSLTLGGYTIEGEGEEYTSESVRVKDVLYHVTLKLHRSKYAASKIEEKDAKAGTRSAVETKATSDFVENVTFQVSRTIKAGVVPEDIYTGYGNVRQNVVVNWTKSVVEYEIIADEYYTLSGTKTVVVEQGELPFGFSASPLCTYESTSKVVNHGNDSEELNSDTEENLRQKQTMVSTYAINLANDIVCNKLFTFWWTTGATMFHGERINIKVPTPAQVFAGVPQKSETSDDTYGTITTYEVRNTISFGGSKTTSSDIVVKVKKGVIVPPVTIKDVKISQSKIEEDSRTKITVTADITYSDNTTAKRDTVVYRAHGASDASDINVTKLNKSVVFVSNNVTSANSSDRINYTNDVTVRYSDGATSVMPFASFQEVGGTILFMGQTVEILVATMVPSYVSLVEGSTSGASVTAWTVNTKSVIGAKTFAQKGNINVTVLPVTVKDVRISQSKIEEISRTKITVTADITYSDNTTARKDTVVYRAHGSNNAATINVKKDGKNVVFVSNNVLSQNSGTRINYTNDITVRYTDGATDIMPFSSFQEVGGTIVFMGQTVEILVATMVPSYVSLVEGNTSINGKVDITAWTVNAQSMIGATRLAQKGDINVSVEAMEHSELGRLLGATASRTLSAVSANLLHNIIVLRYEKGFRVDVDGTLQSEIWKNGDFSASSLNSITSAVHANGKFIPGVHQVHEGANGYWEWYSINAAGQKVYTTYPYKFNSAYASKPNHCKRTVTFNFVGDQMVVYENGVQIGSYSRK